MANPQSLAGKVAIVTGASSGLGRDIAAVYAKSGVNVVVAARRKEELDKLVVELTNEYGGNHLAVPTDLTQQASIKSLFDTTLSSYGRLDIIVNNAGDAYLWSLTDHTPEQIAQLLQILVVGNTMMHYYGLRHLKEQLAKKAIPQGYVVDILSSAGQTFYDHNGVYGPAKHFMAALSRINEQDTLLADENIAFIRLYPSNIKTPLINDKKASPEVWKFIEKAPKLAPKDIALVVRKLTEDGKSADVYLEQLRNRDGEEFISAESFKKEEPERKDEEGLVDYVLRNRE